MKILISCALSLAALACTAQAGTMVKCVEAGGRISYQNQPCALAAKASAVNKNKQVDVMPPPTEQMRPDEMQTITKAPAPATAARARPLTKRELAAKESATIATLRRQEMLRITGQQQASATTAAADAGDDLR